MMADSPMDETSFDFSDIELQEPVEVWVAALGHPEQLTEFLKANKLISNRMRLALAALFEGKLVPPKRKPGRPNQRNPFEELNRGNKTPLKLLVVVSEYQQISRHLGSKEMYGRSDSLIEFLAEKYQLSREQVRDAVRKPSRRKPKAVRKKASSDPVTQFQIWYDKIGDLYARDMLP